jgi:hypothetical protein
VCWQGRFVFLQQHGGVCVVWGFVDVYLGDTNKTHPHPRQLGRGLGFRETTAAFALGAVFCGCVVFRPSPDTGLVAGCATPQAQVKTLGWFIYVAVSASRLRPMVGLEIPPDSIKTADLSSSAHCSCRACACDGSVLIPSARCSCSARWVASASRAAAVTVGMHNSTTCKCGSS